MCPSQMQFGSDPRAHEQLPCGQGQRGNELPMNRPVAGGDRTTEQDQTVFRVQFPRTNSSSLADKLGPKKSRLESATGAGRRP